MVFEVRSHVNWFQLFSKARVAVFVGRETTTKRLRLATESGTISKLFSTSGPMFVTVDLVNNCYGTHD